MTTKAMVMMINRRCHWRPTRCPIDRTRPTKRCHRPGFVGQNRHVVAAQIRLQRRGQTRDLPII
jgi:hypothetical protein